MCGIVGARSRSQALTAEALLAAMRALHHRGPDGQGHWLAADKSAGLAHTRLSIIDLDTGAQPIANENETIRVVVNGELYGFEAIRCNLEKRGHRFRTRSDAEIVLHLYEEYGTGCLAYLRGEFAFVLWDDNRKTLFAARDRFGIKPLFYAESGDTIYLASEAKALFAAGVPAAWDEESVFQVLFACVAQDRSLFRGVHQVPPGHFLVASDRGIELERYWDADYPVAPNGSHENAKVDPRACLEQVRSLLEESVRLRMRADVPVGCLLSGGLDSSVALGIASAQGARPMAAYTISFDHPEYDESAFARCSADFAGANLNVVSAADAVLAEHFVESVGQGEIMQYNAHGTARYILSNAVRESGYKSVLAGEGADELFAGYGFCRPAVLAQQNGNGRLRSRLALAWRLMKPASPQQKVIAGSSRWLARALRVTDLPAPVIASLADRMEVLRSVMAPQFGRRHQQRDPYRALYDSLDAGEKVRGREPAKQLIYLWLKTIFPGYILAADRADMAHSVEVRLPFLDHVLFEYVRSIPVRTLGYGGQNKYVLREAAAPYLAESIRHRPKKPLMAPPFTPRPGSRLFGVIQDVLRSGAMRDLPFFTPGAITLLADDAHRRNGDGRASLDPLFIMAASLCVLQERYRL